MSYLFKPLVILYHITDVILFKINLKCLSLSGGQMLPLSLHCSGNEGQSK